MSAEQTLILRIPHVNQAFGDLVSAMSSDEGLRRWFLRDPAGAIRAHLFPELPVEMSQISRGNRLLFALLSNAGFASWARTYEQHLLERAQAEFPNENPLESLRSFLATSDRNQIYRDLAKATAQFADAELIAALTFKSSVLRDPGVTFIPQSIAVEIETLVYAVAAAAVFVVLTIAIPVQQAEILTRTDLLDFVNRLLSGLEGVRLSERRVISGCSGHAAKPRCSMVAGS